MLFCVARIAIIFAESDNFILFGSIETRNFRNYFVKVLFDINKTIIFLLI